MVLSLAWRNIWRNKVRSLIIMCSVALGILAGLFILALYQGMIDARIRTVIKDETAHLQIHHPTFKEDYKASLTIPDAQEIIDEIRRKEEVSGISARTITRGMLANPTGSAGVEIRGVIPRDEMVVSSLNEKVIEGAYFPGNHRYEVIVGKSLAIKKGLKLRNKVVLTFSDKDNVITSGAFRIIGIYESTNTALDERIVYVDLKVMGSLLNTGDGIHEIAVRLKGDSFLDKTFEELSREFKEVLTETWRQISPETDLMITASNQSNFIILIIIMIALTFGIINTMLMAILERTRETGMMIALGMNKLRVFFLVLLETCILTIVGSPFGIAFAILITWYFGNKGIDLTSIAGAMMGDYGFERVIYPQMPTNQILKIVIMVSATGIISSILPAMRALKMEPADALRK
jgi:ABC-type lipoprotein release transport system permease subunit